MDRSISAGVLLAACLLGCAMDSHARAGDLDPSFGTAGTWTVLDPLPCTPVPGVPSPCSLIPHGLVALASGDLRLAAAHQGYSPCAVHTCVLPTTPLVFAGTADGAARPDFAAGGSMAPFAGQYVYPGAIAAQGEKVITAAMPGIVNFSITLSGSLAAARLNGDGTRDATFGGGSMAYPLAPRQISRIDGLAVQADGKVLVSLVLGLESDLYRPRAVLVRLLPDGTLDTSYGVAGIVDFSAGGSTTPVLVALQPDGHSIAVVPGAMFSGRAWFVSRFDENGVQDPSFNGTGSTFVQFPGQYSGNARAVAIQDDGGIVLAGEVNINGGVARLLPSGALDSRFGAGGLVVLDDNPYPSALAIQPDGRIVVAGGCGGPYGRSCHAVSRLLPSGAPDPSFVYAGPRAQYSGLVLQADGRIVVAGRELVLQADGTIVAAGVRVARYFGSDKPFDIFTYSQLFALQQYRDFLGREADAGGLNFWTAQLDAGLSRGRMIESFFGSPEFQGTIAPVARLYFAYFLRIPDYGGMDFWIGYYRNGNSLEAISNQFAVSREFTDRYGSLDDASFIALVYQNVLGRAPDPGGASFWLAQLNAGMTRGQMMLQFSESPEYRSLIANEVYVTMAYIGMLRRAPEPGGFAFWVDYMDRGNSGLALLDGFLSSAEYHARFMP